MIADLERHRDELVAPCRRFGVRRLDVFGSAVTGDFQHARGDVDFLVELEPPAGSTRFDAYFGLKEGLERLLGVPVDLVDPSALRNPCFTADVEATLTVLHAGTDA